NRAGVSWHTTLLGKSSVLYLCEGEGGTDRLRAPISAVKTVEQKLADGATCTCLPAFCPLRNKGIQSPAAAARSYCIKIVLYPCLPRWLMPWLLYSAFLPICSNWRFSSSVSFS